MGLPGDQAARFECVHQVGNVARRAAQNVAELAHVWRSADKIIYSRTLQDVSTPHNRLERAFEADSVRVMKAQAERDLSVGGPDLSAHAIKAGLVDVYQLFVTQIIVGGGKRALPAGYRQALELLDERRLVNGTIYLHYRAR